MGRPASALDSSARRRFVIIQIDGLAHEYLLRATAGGHMPTLRRMLAEGVSAPALALRSAQHNPRCAGRADVRRQLGHPRVPLVREAAAYG